MSTSRRICAISAATRRPSCRFRLASRTKTAIRDKAWSIPWTTGSTPAPGTIRVRARFNNADGALAAGSLRARSSVGGGTPHPACWSTMRRSGTDQDKKFVMVVDQDNRVQYREVYVGDHIKGLRVITKGLRRASASS